jgi:hypothetical protein
MRSPGRPEGGVDWSDAARKRDVVRRMDDFFIDAYYNCGDITKVVEWMSQLPVEVFDPDRK